jgi:hypothetical protein
MGQFTNSHKSSIILIMESEEQQDISRVPKQLQAHVYRKGMTGNPHGRPVGSFSMKEYVKRKLSTMTEEEREEFLEGIDKRVIWEMAEDKPKQGTDITSGGEKLSPILVKFIDENNRDTEGV